MPSLVYLQHGQGNFALHGNMIHSSQLKRTRLTDVGDPAWAIPFSSYYNPTFFPGQSSQAMVMGDLGLLGDIVHPSQSRMTSKMKVETDHLAGTPPQAHLTNTVLPPSAREDLHKYWDWGDAEINDLLDYLNHKPTQSKTSAGTRESDGELSLQDPHLGNADVLHPGSSFSPDHSDDETWIDQKLSEWILPYPSKESGFTDIVSPAQNEQNMQAEETPKTIITNQLPEFNKAHHRISKSLASWKQKAKKPWVVLRPIETISSSETNLGYKTKIGPLTIQNLVSSYLDLVTYATLYNIALISKISQEDKQRTKLDATENTRQLISQLIRYIFRIDERNFVLYGFKHEESSEYPKLGNLLRNLHRYFLCPGDGGIPPSRMAMNVIWYWHLTSPQHWKLIFGAPEQAVAVIRGMVADKQVNLAATKLISEIQHSARNLEHVNPVVY
ncbi:hypothetical protein PCANC_04766 [Puccinia coronata f. sp. avenae]|uniref:Uncharacterized protein n=1 Tax=Puccinia coronata f. sp. avenae TaxID=200324 RepID=A0A2N5VWT1_9BASI|nr:hypothetical protein PCANC_04766 [Puccinia coronata f. sp. avenae]